LIQDCLNLIIKDNSYNKNINFKILLDDNPNAFINEKNNLFITTGLLKYLSSYEALIGVLAHEVGHLENFHINKRIDSIKNLSLYNQLGTLSLIATSILANNTDYLLEALTSNQLGVKNYYSSFSREQEREADIYAAKKIKEMKISPLPLINFLKLLEKKSYKQGLNEESFRFLSHPVYKERFKILSNDLTKKEYYSNRVLDNRFRFIKAKLFGYTEKNNGNFKMFLKDDYLKYSNSIMLSRNGKLKQSLIILNKLIKKHPSNIYFLETKADLLLKNGFSNEAKSFYKKILKRDQNNKYVLKRIFEISYDNFKNDDNYKITNNFFYENTQLLIFFSNDLMLLNKYNEIALLLEKIDWMDFIEIIKSQENNSRKINIENSKKILNRTSDNELKIIIKQKIKVLNNV
tara:strand:- start:877 stop:2091 length:1215 start_codon:yes stop_codon:yes gene_type:complete